MMRRGFAPIFAGLLAAALPAGVCAQGVIDEWSRIEAPPPPALSPVTIEPKSTALLVLDLARQTCDAAHRPRCVAMLPRIDGLVARLRAKGVFVVYTLGLASTPTDILTDAPRAGEPIVTAGPDKFVGTTLETILKDKGIKTVVTVGAAAHGAVLHTAAESAFRGFRVVVPVDGMAAETAYAEQYTAWDLVNAPRLADKVTLTSIDRIE